MSDGRLAALAAEVERTRADDRGRLLRVLTDLLKATARDFSQLDPELFSDIALVLIPVAPVFDRIAFAKAVADRAPRLPRVVDRLLADLPMVARPLLQRAPLAASRLTEMVAEATPADTAALVAIASRRSLPIEVSDALIDDGREDVLLALAGNPGAKISATGFDRLAGHAREATKMDLTLATRDDLPPPIARLLTRRLALATERRLSDMILRDSTKRRGPFVLRGL
ncbi:MAG: DUF2336 domain-containing protein [Hyphomicrobiales bacterium]|nr:DUF2336 domain-containing protein [Hyphomicrobiales bacterium]